jgi:hypothetical protein
MNYGPLEFAAYLKRKDSARGESAAVKAAREAAPNSSSKDGDSNRLTIISGGPLRPRLAGDSRVEAVSVYEAVAVRAPYAPEPADPVRVVVRESRRPVVLVLSSHQAVQWVISLERGVRLEAVLLSGFGESTVSGAGDALVASIGGFYAFKRGSVEFKHLEKEVRRCTGRDIDRFHSAYAGHRFIIGD